MNQRNFFSELKRRNVYKVADAYAIVGWLLAQVATQVVPFFEIPNDLAKIADLKVISRTSVMQYKNTATRNLPEIAQALKVAHVLEGSVQRSANRVRVSAQLIDARNDMHVWAEKYDRDLADVFAIKSEIAQKIADQLQARHST